MTSEKQIIFQVEDHLEQPCSKTCARRRTLLFTLVGGAALLTVIITIGLGMSMFCDQLLRGDIRALSLSMIPEDVHTAAARFHARQLPDTGLVDTGMTSVIAGVTATRPIKFFGPSIAPELATAWKLAHNVSSVVRKDVENSLSDSIAARGAGIGRRPWQPRPGLNWTYQLNQPPTADQLKNPAQFNVWNIDLFDTPQSSIQTIQAAGSRVICYFSGGTDEDWRSDHPSFNSAEVGKPMGDWPGENWIDTNSANVRRIMANRISLAMQKGCDGVDPDNMDAYSHDTGFNLTQNDAISYVTYLSQQATRRGLAISLKNSGDIIPSVLNVVSFSVEEACGAYSECELYTPFTRNNKPVFHVEYPKGYGVVDTATVASSSMAAICTCKPQYKFSPIVKNNNLDTWQQNCS